MSSSVIESRLPQDGDHTDFFRADSSSPHKRKLHWIAMTAILAMVGSALLIVMGIQRFGSVPSALAYLRGELLIPDAYAKSFGTASKDDLPSIEFLLTNYATRPITILGAHHSCTCVSASDLPMVVQPHGKAILRLRARRKWSKLGYYSERVRLFADYGDLPVVLHVTGKFQ